MQPKRLSNLSACAALAASIGLALAGSAALTGASAHSGGLSLKDQCHRDTAAGERHWHLPGTKDRGGPCVKRDGRTVKAQDPAPAAAAAPSPATVTVPSDVYTGLVAERDGLRKSLTAARKTAETRGAAIASRDRELRQVGLARDNAVRGAASASRAAEQAKRQAQLAREDAAAAEARARGAGPPVSPRCVRGVEAALDSGWRFSDGEKEALRRACLY